MTDSITAGSLWTFRERSDCEEPQYCWPWDLDMYSDPSGVVEFQYQSSGEVGTDRITVFPYLVDVADGPSVSFAIVTIDSLCPDEPYFQDPAFREELKDFWEGSNPVEDPSELTQNPKERAAWIEKQPDGSYELDEWTRTSADACTAGKPQLVPPLCTQQGPPCVVGNVHTHPLAPNGELFPKATCGEEVDFGMCPFPSKWDKDLAQTYGVPNYVLYHNGVMHTKSDRTWEIKRACINDAQLPEVMSNRCEAQQFD